MVNDACVTMTLKLQVPPLVSEVTLTVVVPTGKNDPEGVLVVIAPQSPKGTAASKVTCAPTTSFSVVFAVTVMLSGQSRTQLGVGGVLLSTVAVLSKVLSALFSSVVELPTVTVLEMTV